MPGPAVTPDLHVTHDVVTHARCCSPWWTRRTLAPPHHQALGQPLRCGGRSWTGTPHCPTSQVGVLCCHALIQSMCWHAEPQPCMSECVGMHTEYVLACRPAAMHVQPNHACAELSCEGDVSKHQWFNLRSVVYHGMGTGTHPQLRVGHFTIYGASYYSYLYARCLSSAIWNKFMADDPLNPDAGES